MIGLEAITPVWEDYELIDSGCFEKLERFGKFVTLRPEPQAVWNKSLSEEEWERLATAIFRRDAGSDERGRWLLGAGMPEQWHVAYKYKDMHLKMRLGLTSFKHVGLFPEQAANWNFIYDSVAAIRTGLKIAEKTGSTAGIVADAVTGAETRAGSVGKTATAGAGYADADTAGKPRVLNLFAYTGGASLAACAAGADVTHVDSVRQVISWGRGNMEASGLDGIRWVVEDALKFVRREVRRGKTYHGIILDPPAYGRGPDGEKWVLEENIGELLELCSRLLVTGERPKQSPVASGPSVHGHPVQSFMVVNLYSMGLSALLAKSAVNQLFPKPEMEEFGELFFYDRAEKMLPLGVFYRCAY